MAEIKLPEEQVISIVDESLSANEQGTYHLSVLAYKKGFAVAVVDAKKNKYLALSVSSVLNFDRVKIPSLPFASVTCCVAHNKYTFIPSGLYDDDMRVKILEFNHEVKDNEKVMVDMINSVDSKVIYTVSADLISGVRSRFPNAKFVHSSFVFINGILHQYKNEQGKKVFANFYNDFFEISVFEGKNLLFCNSFAYKTPEDITYYILFVYEQLNLNPETIDLILSGEIDKTAKEHSLLYAYIRNVKFLSRPEGFDYSYKFNDISGHKFFSLFTQYLCE